MTTEQRIDPEALRRLADAATEGPWEADHSEEDNSSIKEVGREWWDGLAFAGRKSDAEFIAAARTAVPALLDALAAAERRATRAEAQSAIRGRAVVMYRDRAREADARIKAVQDLIDQADTAGDWTVTCSSLQWAIDGTVRRALEGSVTHNLP